MKKIHDIAFANLYKLPGSYRELYLTCTWIVVRILFSLKKVCMFLSVGTCTYSDVHCYFLVLVFLSWYEFNTMHLQVKCIMCVFLYRDFFHIMLIILYVYFSTCPHACTRIYDIHISCSIKNSARASWLYLLFSKQYSEVNLWQYGIWLLNGTPNEEVWMSEVTDASKDTGKRAILFSTKGLIPFEDLIYMFILSLQPSFLSFSILPLSLSFLPLFLSHSLSPSFLSFLPSSLSLSGSFDWSR